jgi:hypothetical protein
MKTSIPAISLFLLVFLPVNAQDTGHQTSLFNGKTFAGWEGDTDNTWRIEDGAIVGGSLAETVPRNDFLVSEKSYGNFVLKFRIKLTGSDGFVNSGIQFWSERNSDPSHEMIGYQADWGEKYWGSLYDELRRNKTLAAPDSLQILQWVKKDNWNDYVIRAEDRHIQLFVNGHKTVDYTEEDQDIPKSGQFGIQIHGGGKALVAVKDIFIEELE